MQSKAATPEKYLAALPQDRREAISAVRDVILKNLDKDIEEGMQYGMIGYYVPHRVFPAGYHCDPSQPLPFAGLGSQKQHMALYLMCVYGDAPTREAFVKEWKATGKKLDMGKACIRFKKLEDVPLEVIGRLVKKVTAKKYIAGYQDALGQRPPVAKAASAAPGKPRRKPAVKKKKVTRTK